jgi:hypothetical protein
MNRPPLIMRIRIQNPEHEFGLWLPLFLLLPLVLVVLIILSPLIIIGFLVLCCMGWGKPALLVPGAVWRVFCAARGLRVDVDNTNDKVKIFIV